MSEKEFPVRGHCLSTNPIIVNYLKGKFERFKNNVYSKKSTGVAWNENKWWYITKQSNTPKYDPLVIMDIITKINEMNNPTIATTLSTSSGVVSNNTVYPITTTTTTAPIYNPNDSLTDSVWIYRGAGISTGTGTTTTKILVTEPTKLRIKCQSLKKNLKVSLLQINLK